MFEKEDCGENPFDCFLEHWKEIAVAVDADIDGIVVDIVVDIDLESADDCWNMVNDVDVVDDDVSFQYVEDLDDA
jgi:hypothetical protein